MSRFVICGLIAPVLVVAIFSLGFSQDAKKPAQKKERDLDVVVAGNNQFAFDLYHQLSQKPGNKFFSPYSISTALATTYAGARGNTAKEMAQTLHFNLDNEHLHSAFGELIREVQGVGKKRKYELSVANSLCGDKTDLSLDPKFLRLTQTDYQAGFQFVDFQGDAEGLCRTINGWVEEKTKTRIKDLVPKGLFKNTTRLVLVNAIHFKAAWSVPFSKMATRPEDFAVAGGAAVKVPMMVNIFQASYIENADFQMAEFTYMGNELSMVVILPKKKDGLPEVEKKLSAKALSQTLARGQKAILQVAMPKFKITGEFRMDEELAKLGMRSAFLPGVADLTGMETNVRRQNALCISAIVHKAFVEVDENGTEAAAAATGATVGATGGADLIPFRAQHPFLFVVRHNPSDSIVFVGRVSDPRGN